MTIARECHDVSAGYDAMRSRAVEEYMDSMDLDDEDNEQESNQREIDKAYWRLDSL